VTFAKTYGANWPQEYVVQTPVNAPIILALARHILSTAPTAVSIVLARTLPKYPSNAFDILRRAAPSAFGAHDPLDHLILVVVIPHAWEAANAEAHLLSA
jgi:hypothetical protein